MQPKRNIKGVKRSPGYECHHETTGGAVKQFSVRWRNAIPPGPGRRKQGPLGAQAMMGDPRAYLEGGTIRYAGPASPRQPP